MAPGLDFCELPTIGFADFGSRAQLASGAMSPKTVLSLLAPNTATPHPLANQATDVASDATVDYAEVSRFFEPANLADTLDADLTRVRTPFPGSMPTAIGEH